MISAAASQAISGAPGFLQHCREVLWFLIIIMKEKKEQQQQQKKDKMKRNSPPPPLVSANPL